VALTDFGLVSLHFYHLFTLLFFQICVLHKELDIGTKKRNWQGGAVNQFKPTLGNKTMSPSDIFVYIHPLFFNANSVLQTEKLGNIRSCKQILCLICCTFLVKPRTYKELFHLNLSTPLTVNTSATQTLLLSILSSE